MSFLAKETFPIPTTDLLSWTFDKYQHDWDEPRYIDAVDTQKSISARQARTIIRKLIAGFHAMGLQKGDCVCIHSANDIYYAIFFLAIVGAQGVFAATNPAYTPHELAHTLKTAKAKFVLTQEIFLAGVEKAAKEAGLTEEKIVIFNPLGPRTKSRHPQWADLLGHGQEDWVRFDDLETSSGTTAAFLFSSGTTGLPKAVCLSHYNLVAEITLMWEVKPKPYKVHYLFALPMFHAATAPNAFCMVLRLGAKAFVFPRFDPEKWFWAMNEHKITDMALVPPIVVMAVNSPLSRKYSLKSVRCAYVGAAPLDAALQARMQELIGNDAPLTQVYGMTESSCVAFMLQYPEADTTGSVGRPFPNMDVKLLDMDGKEINEYNARGEICMRGPLMTKGYFENPEANARDWDKDGFFHTGDIGYCDKRTKLWYIVDRKKELIKVRGFQVAPGELEGVLLEHPEVADCAVIGITDPKRQDSELVKAFVVRRNAKSQMPSEEDILTFMKERLASYKAITGGIDFIDEIPKSVSGKILKRVLKERIKKEGKSAKL